MLKKRQPNIYQVLVDSAESAIVMGNPKSDLSCSLDPLQIFLATLHGRMTALADRYDEPDLLAAHEAIEKLSQTMQKIQQNPVEPDSGECRIPRQRLDQKTLSPVA